ncbi:MULTISPECIES: hypothetical protein [unclassified Saccharopolyspora]|uniref:hypothetical protein n=1 Tax=unclassified Saccharopolyspora TaxID=2646250 RepID=UPI001CD299F1|nr:MULTISPECIES: hypothetical protein [unclassified Saccharopolyspora]MCA1186172.1 hypothetical protein [Saccharopolyspora sp. 6T]MCA1278375.1 hypothetical protein [Saccharopolyspora sp. 7B]
MITEAFQAWMIETRSAPTAVNKHKALRVFFGWLLNGEREIDRSPMERVREPGSGPGQLIPVLEGDVTSQLLEACTGKDLPEPAGPGDHLRSGPNAHR